MRYTLLLFLLFGLFTNCSKPQAPTFIGIEDFRVDNIGSKESAVSAALIFYNNNAFPVTIKSAEADLFIENQLSGHSNIQQSISVAAKDSFSVPLQMTIDSKKVLNNALSFLLRKEVQVEIKGQAKLERSGISIKVPINYKGTQVLKW